MRTLAEKEPPRLALGVALALVGVQGCGPDCAKLKRDLSSAVAAFAPVSSNACSSAADCTVVDDSILRGGRACGDGCGTAASYARAAELSAFLQSDPGVTAACTAFVQARCDKGEPVPLCPAVVGACEAGQCVPRSPGGGG